MPESAKEDVMTEKEIADMKAHIKNLQDENENLKKENEKLIEERAKYQSFYETDEKILNELGPGTIQLLGELKKLLTRAHRKIEHFELSSPLAWVEFYDDKDDRFL